MKLISSLFIALALPVLARAQAPSDTITVFMIGDSTMANKPLDKENRERGWGGCCLSISKVPSRSTTTP